MYFSVRRTRSRPRRFGRLRLARSNDTGSAFSQILTVACPDAGRSVCYSRRSTSLANPLFKRRFHPRSGTLSLGGPLPVPIEVRPDVGAPGAASPTNKSRFKVGQPNVIRPFFPTDYRRMAAFVIGAVDEQTTNARYSHFSKGDFILATFCGAAAGECGHSR